MSEAETTLGHECDYCDGSGYVEVPSPTTAGKTRRARCGLCNDDVNFIHRRRPEPRETLAALLSVAAVSPPSPRRETRPPTSGKTYGKKRSRRKQQKKRRKQGAKARKK